MKIHVCTSGAFFCSQFSVRLADTVRPECRDGSEEGLAARRTLQERLVPFVPRAAYYGFGEVRVATLALLIFTALSG
jgi:hypothetical protein